jgi:hypothetical protein
MLEDFKLWIQGAVQWRVLAITVLVGDGGKACRSARLVPLVEQNTDGVLPGCHLGMGDDTKAEHQEPDQAGSL